MGEIQTHQIVVSEPDCNSSTQKSTRLTAWHEVPTSILLLIRMTGYEECWADGVRGRLLGCLTSARKQAKSVRDPLAPNKSFPKVACDYKEVCIFLRPRECTTVIWSNLRRYEWKLPLFFFQESICTGQNRSNSRRTGGFAISDKFVWIFPSISLNLICINPLWTLSFSVWTLQ